MLPESGSDIDFKRATLRVVSPVPRYVRQPFSKSSCKWPCYFNGWLCANNLRQVLIDSYFWVWDHTTWLSLGAASAQIVLIWFLIWSQNRTEIKNEKTFYALQEFLEELDPNATNRVRYWLSVINAHQKMANMIRRSTRVISRDLSAGWYNRFHLNSRRCKCCRLIVHGLREPKRLRAVFTERCPFCDWYWFL